MKLAIIRPMWIARMLPVLFVVTFAGQAAAAPAPQRTRFELPSSNGHGVVLLDLEEARLTQFREHVFAAEEPVIDAEGQDVWDGGQFATVHTRDLLFDAYFGLRAAGEQFWLTTAPVDLEASGYVPGTGVATMVQQIGALRATTHAFALQGLEGGGFVLALALENTGGQAIAGVEAFSLHNFHLGFGRPQRPWEVPQDLAANGETIVVDGDEWLIERGFAGVIAIRGLGAVSHHGVGPGADLYGIVNDGAGDFPDNAPPMNAVDDAVSGLQWSLGELAPGEVAWAAIAVIHDPDPFAGAAAQAKLDALLMLTDADSVVDAELGAWDEFQAGVTLPAGVSETEAGLLRQGAAMLHMGQVREDRYYLREWLGEDGEVRRTRFKGVDDQPVTLPALIKHRGSGAVLASLPPGEWTYAWIRDGSYAVAAMAALGMHDAARAGLAYYLDAEAGRFKDWDELAAYAMPPYQISLVRYHGFGVEETDFNEFGPNLEFDGFGLFLWALRGYEVASGDVEFAAGRWSEIGEKVGDVLVALVDPETGLLRADSSIWETHWSGRERRWAYTNITAARGLCDAAVIAERVGDGERAAAYRAAGEGLRAAIATQLTDGDGAIAANREELAIGEGYWDAAVLDAIAMGLFDPTGKIAAATLAGLDLHLRVDAGPGWSRNDDRWDHANVADLSPWGGEYDSAEWVVTDLRGAVALRMSGETDRSAALIDWVTAQTAMNYGMVAETYDEVAGTYKFNAPMLGFGAGALTLALADRAAGAADPACGAYFDEGEAGTTSGTTSDSGDTGGETGADVTTTTADATGVAPTTGAVNTSGGASATFGTADESQGSTTPQDDGSGCGCRSGRVGPSWLPLLVLGALRRRRPARARGTMSA